MKPTNKRKIGLYIRVSTEEQASNPEGSIKSQEQRLHQHVEFKNHDGHLGEVTNVFIDAGRSGKDTNRPELQRLLKAIREKEIDLVLVSELSRLSRSIKDFCGIWDLMREHGCGFQSLREQFDTTTAAGEMVLYTMANLAQFERRQTSERIVANFGARAQRGLFNGGSIPVGYRRHPEKKGYLVIDEEEAKVVREAYKTFLSEGSLAKAGQALNERGFRLPRRRACGGDKVRLGYFTIDNLHAMLTNPVYAGKRNYITNGEKKSAKAVWDGVVSENTFEMVQKVLKKNYRRHKSASNKRHPYQLSGIFYCAQCGDRLCGKSAHGNSGKIAYYEHAWSTRRQACLNKKVFACNPNRIQAKIIEKYVWEKIEELLTMPEVAQSLIEQAKSEHESQVHVTEMDKIRNKVRGVEEQIEALAEHLSKIPKGINPTPVFSQMQRLETIKAESQSELEKMSQSGICTDVPVGLKDYRAYLTALRSLLGLADSPELKSKIIKWCVAKVELLPSSFKIHYFVGKSVIVPVDWDPEGPKPSSPGDGAKKTSEGIHKSPSIFSAPSTSDLFLKFGSNTLTNGAGDRA